MNSGFMSVLLGLLVASYPGPDYWISFQVSGHVWIIGGAVIGLNRAYQRFLILRKLQKKKQPIDQKELILEDE